MSKFKVGDKVVCILKERPSYFNDDGRMDYMLDRKTVLEISRVNKSDVCVLGEYGDDEWYLNYEDIELYEEHIKKDFKVGDKVVCTAKERPDYFNSSGKMDYMLGRSAILEVKSVVDDGVWIDEEDMFFGGWWLRNEDIELYEEPTKAPYKVGDKVVCTLKERPDYFVEEMDYMLDRKVVLEVERVESKGVWVFGKDTIFNGWYLEHKDIELYVEPYHYEDADAYNDLTLKDVPTLKVRGVDIKGHPVYQNKEFRLGQRVIYQNENGVFVGIVSAVYDEEIFEVPFAIKRSIDITHLFDEDETVETHIIEIIK